MRIVKVVASLLWELKPFPLDSTLCEVTCNTFRLLKTMTELAEITLPNNM